MVDVRHTYRTWTRRLVAAHGPDQPQDLTAGDLKDLIARHVLAARRGEERRRSGRSAEENAVGAFRHLWGYMVEKGWVTDNVATRLRKPTRTEPHRRPVQPDEIVLLRHLAVSTGRDPLLDEVTLALPERLGLRRIELCRLRFCDLDLDRAAVQVWGKGDKDRTMPLPPVLAGLLERYVEDRRPAHLSLEEWLSSDDALLRRPPTTGHARDGRAHVIGLSLGAAVGTVLVARHPELARSAMLTGAPLQGVSTMTRVSRPRRSETTRRRGTTSFVMPRSRPTNTPDGDEAGYRLRGSTEPGTDQAIVRARKRSLP